MKMNNTPVFGTTIGKVNNFDLIRLIAALQVAFGHGANHLEVNSGPWFAFVSYLPAVPAFFGISGFLIANTYCRKPDLGKYARNRMLRLYPALWVCLIITIVLLLWFRVISMSVLPTFSFLRWLFCQTTFLQFYTPDYFRSWGTGTPNGSLWTISVELQFYVFLPVYIFLYRKLNRKLFFALSFAMFAASWASGLVLDYFGQDRLAGKLLHVSLAPYLHYFFLGIWSFFFWDKIRSFFSGKFVFWLAAYAGYILIFRYAFALYQPSYYPGALAWLHNCLQWCTILSFAFTAPTLSHSVLRGNDISYGVYIYHMIVINILLSISLPALSPAAKLVIMLSLTIILATLSWLFVEKPALNRKKKITSI